MTCVKKEFKTTGHKYDQYKGLRFYNGDCPQVVDSSGDDRQLERDTRHRLRSQRSDSHLKIETRLINVRFASVICLMLFIMNRESEN
jgi:hypothetical protein